MQQGIIFIPLVLIGKAVISGLFNALILSVKSAQGSNFLIHVFTIFYHFVFSYHRAIFVICMTVAEGVANCAVGIDSYGRLRVQDLASSTPPPSRAGQLARVFPSDLDSSVFACCA